MGWKGEDPQTIDVNELPNEVEIVIETESWQSESGEVVETPRVKWVNKIGGVQLAQMSAGDSVAFRDKMKGLVAATRAKRAAPAEAQEDLSFNHGANAPVAGKPAPKAAGTSRRAF